MGRPDGDARRSAAEARELRIGYDATPLLGRRTGIGWYADALLRELAAGPERVTATAFSLRGRGRLPDVVPPGVDIRAQAVSARALRSAWAHSEVPAVETLCGPVDLFHATNFVLPPLRRAAGVVTVHDLAFLHHRGTVDRASLAYRELVPRSLRRAGAVCTPSRAVAEQLLSAYRVPEDRVCVTPLGVDRSWAAAPPADEGLRRDLGLPGSYVVAVGTLEPRKNLPLLVAAYRVLRSRGVDVPPLVLVGAEGWGDALDTSGVDDRILRTGYLDRAVLQSVVAGAATLAFPSTDEGFGLPPLEALAAGVPVVAADLPVLQEVLGSHATFAPPHDPGAFADGMLTALAEPRGPADGSRRSYAAGFTWARCARATRTAYRVALDR